MIERFERLRVPAVSVALALAATVLLLLAVDAPPLDAFRQLWEGSLDAATRSPPP